MRVASLTMLITVFLFGCANTNSSSITQPTSTAATPPTTIAVGVLLGAAGGALIGNQVGGGSGKTIATIAGGIIGAGIGAGIAQQLTEQDKKIADNTAQKAFLAPVGTPITWTNPETGNSGTFTTAATSLGEANCLMLEQRIDLADGRGEQVLPVRHCRDTNGVFVPA